MAAGVTDLGNLASAIPSLTGNPGFSETGLGGMPFEGSAAPGTVLTTAAGLFSVRA